MSAEMDALVKSASDKLEALEEALYQIDRIRGVYAAEDGTVEATADGHGALVGLWLSEAVTQKNPKEVGELVVQASQQAVAEAGKLRAQVLAKLNGEFTGETPSTDGGA
ncbi:MAG: YbaB/EbfC family nucleoid-associated protein [Mycobacteriaceae bacterium]|nr:YbaB/EbfC family nucleoid-associated protein [Mycobacteriaceae bacterium]